LLPSDLLLLLQGQFRNLKFIKFGIFLRLSRDDVKETTLEDGPVIIVEGLDSILGVFELHKRKTFALAIALFERHVNLIQSAVDRKTKWN
jgi:hypothetical protein